MGPWGWWALGLCFFGCVDMTAAVGSAYFKAGGLRHWKSRLFWFHRLFLCLAAAVMCRTIADSGWAAVPWAWFLAWAGQWMGHAALSAWGWKLFINRQRRLRDANPAAFIQRFDRWFAGSRDRAASPRDYVSEGPDAARPAPGEDAAGENLGGMGKKAGSTGALFFLAKVIILAPLFFFCMSWATSIIFISNHYYPTHDFHGPWGELCKGIVFMSLLFMIGVFPVVSLGATLILLTLKLFKRFNEKHVARAAFGFSALIAITSEPLLQAVANPFFYLTMVNGWLWGRLFWRFWQGLKRL